METLALIAVLLGLITGIAITTLYFKNYVQRQIKQQSAIMLEKVKQVCKLITVEGEFSEIFTHRDVKNLFFKMFQFEKKALIVIKAKALIGFDLTRISIDISNEHKTVHLTQFPEPEILSIETDFEYYDIQKGIMNKMTEVDLTEITKKSKDYVRDKAINGQLFIIAKKQATDTISVIREIIESMGWQLSIEYNGNLSGLPKSPEIISGKDIISLN